MHIFPEHRWEPHMLFDIAWMNRAACQKADPEMFFPIGDGAMSSGQVAEARAVCRSCPVCDDCRRYSLETGQGYGIWGGTDEDERRTMRAVSQRRRPAGTARKASGPPARPR
jgi:WhiB family transcriptional regulator, redox-sensing transcriptional regulator